MKSIAIVGSRGIPAAYGGFETFAEELSVRLVQAGVEVTVYCERGTANVPVYRGVRLKHVPRPAGGPLGTIAYDIVCVVRALRHAEVIYMLGYGTALFCLLPVLAGRQLWLNMDGLEWRRAKWSRVAKAWLRINEWIALRIAHRVIADAAAVKADLIRRHRLAHDRIDVVAYGAQVPAVMSSPVPAAFAPLMANGYYIVVCRPEPENHLLEIVQGFVASSSSRMLLVVSGLDDGEYSARVRRAADARVWLPGGIYDKSVLQTLRVHATAYLHGHSVGGTNPSLLEAMACGNPVVAHDNPFNREVAGSAARYFGSVFELGQEIDRADRDDAWRAEAGRAGVAIVAARYNWDGVAAQYAALLDETALRQAKLPLPTWR